MPACLPWITLDSREAILWGSLMRHSGRHRNSCRIPGPPPASASAVHRQWWLGQSAFKTVLAATGLEQLRLATTPWILCSGVP